MADSTDHAVPNTCRTCVHLWAAEALRPYCTSKRVEKALGEQHSWGNPVSVAFRLCAGTYWVKR